MAKFRKLMIFMVFKRFVFLLLYGVDIGSFTRPEDILYVDEYGDDSI
jgi:hypothetical protein